MKIVADWRSNEKQPLPPPPPPPPSVPSWKSSERQTTIPGKCGFILLFTYLNFITYTIV